METKKCSTCKHHKPIESFHRKGKGLQPKCKSCQSAYLHNHYLCNKAAYNRSKKKARQKVQNFISECKTKPCADCKQTYPPYVMDFDHKYNKDFCINRGEAQGIAKSRLIAEMAKCDVVCANCHRIRTHKRLSSRAELLPP